MPADALREDRHGVRTCEDHTDFHRVRIAGNARQPDMGEGRQAVQQASQRRSVSERIGECASGSRRLTGQDEPANGDVQIGGLNEHVRSQERCERWRLPSEGFTQPAQPGLGSGSAHEMVTKHWTLRCLMFFPGGQKLCRARMASEFLPSDVFASVAFQVSVPGGCRSLYSSLDV